MHDPRDSRLRDDHVRPLTAFIEQLRANGLAVPNVDPDDGGVNARALFLLETPGPQAVGTGYVSCSNPDPSARNMRIALDWAGFARSDVLLWNVVPQCISTLEQNRNVSNAQIRDAAPDTQAFIDLLPALKVVILCGKRAQQAEKFLSLKPHVQLLKTYHSGAQSYNHQRLRDHVHATFAEARCLLS